MKYNTGLKIDNIVGEVIKNIYVSDFTLIIVTNKNSYFIDVHGDCCSTSLWSIISDIQKVVDGSHLYLADPNYVILNIEDLSEEEINKYFEEVTSAVNENHRYDDSAEVYGFKLVTSLGSCDFVFVNWSNGYYGGWMPIF